MLYLSFVMKEKNCPLKRLLYVFDATGLYMPMISLFKISGDVYPGYC